MRTFWIYTMAILVYIVGYVAFAIYLNSDFKVNHWAALAIIPSMLIHGPAIHYWISYFRKRIKTPDEK